MFYSIDVSILILIFFKFVESDRIDDNLYIEKTIEVKLNDAEARFFAIGDWGGPEDAGTLTDVPRRCAIKMKNSNLRPHFVVSTGDNIYPEGVTADTAGLFQERFQNVFPEWISQRDWYLVAGNHDWYGDVIEQVKYSAINENWKFPALFYSVRYLNKKKKKESNAVVELIYIDTVVLCGGTRLSNGQKIDGKPMGPENVNRANAMWAWIERKLHESRAPYVFVVGHYPIYSMSGELKDKEPYGSFTCLEQRLLPLLHGYKVTGYISGHEHNLQYMTTYNQDHTVHHIVSGGGHLMRVKPQIYPANQWNLHGLFYYPSLGDNLNLMGTAINGVQKPKPGDSTGGFASLRLTLDGGVLQFHSTVHTYGLDSDKFDIYPRKPQKG